MTVLVTGATGQLGRAVLTRAPPNMHVVALAREEFDLRDSECVRGRLALEQPVVVVNTAAYTAVDRAEADRDQAFAVNAQGVFTLANACESVGARLIHVSTDFVFDGAQGKPYRPTDTPHPLNVYGASKLAGEVAVAATAGLHWCVVRTAWLYAAGTPNFLSTMLRLFRQGGEVGVVCDQIGTPTHAASLADAIWRIATDKTVTGVLHYTDGGVASWYDFATAILEEAQRLGLAPSRATVKPITTRDYPTPAARPSYSVLDKSDAWRLLNIAPLHWREHLRRAIEEIAQ